MKTSCGKDQHLGYEFICDVPQPNQITAFFNFSLTLPLKIVCKTVQNALNTVEYCIHTVHTCVVPVPNVKTTNIILLDISLSLIYLFVQPSMTKEVELLRVEYCWCLEGGIVGGWFPIFQTQILSSASCSNIGKQSPPRVTATRQLSSQLTGHPQSRPPASYQVS